MSGWNNDNKCMAATKSHTRCKNRISDGDFCRLHSKTKEYHVPTLLIIQKNDILDNDIKQQNISTNIKNIFNAKLVEQLVDKLNNNYKIQTSKLDDISSHTLLGIYNSWSDVPLEKRIYIDNNWWDIDILIDHISQALNNSCLENPFPRFPYNPFNRNFLSIDDIIKIKNRIKFINEKINITLKIFINMSKHILIKCRSESIDNKDRFSLTLLTKLQSCLRYKIINFRDSQNCLTGYWVAKKIAYSKFELLYNVWKQTPYQMYDPYFNEIIENPDKELIRHKLNNMDRETWSIDNDPTREYITD